MKRNLYLLLLAFVCLFSACSKKEAITDVVVIVPPVTISNISLPAFDNSTWVQVAGGTALIQYKSTDTKDSTVTKDSVDLKNLSTYKKTLSKGTYDITISSKNQSAAADTFIRVTETAKGYTVPSQQAPVFTEKSTDGLITIGKSFIKDGTVPTFKTDTGTKIYKLGLTNGFYYLYVKGGLQGAISFTAKTGGQAVVKKLSLVAAKHLNMSVVTNGVSGVSVVFTDFAYNQVNASSATLLTLNINPDRMSGYTNYFIATDENGNILNETKYIAGTTTFKMVSNIPFEKDRFNFYMIQIPNVSDTKPGVFGFLQIKKGSVYTSVPATRSTPQNFPLAIQLKNATQFDKLDVSTDRSIGEITSPADAGNLINLGYSNTSKLWVQVLKNNTVMYNFFDIAAGTNTIDVDLSQCTKTPLVKQITAPINSTYFNVNVAGKNDVTPTYQYDHDYSYRFGSISSYSDRLSYYYPAEPFKQYVTSMTYTINDLNYNLIKIGSSIPDKADTFDASFNISGKSMADFKPSCSGTFDFYEAFFVNDTGTPNFYSYICAPSSAAGYTNVKFPDFSKYINFRLDINAVKLKKFTLYQKDNYDETKLDYYLNYDQYYINSKTMIKNY